MSEAISRLGVRRRSADPAVRSAPLEPLGYIRNARAEAVALLAEVVARLHDVELPIVQLIGVSPGLGNGMVARQFAVACVAAFGRTLLLSSGGRADAEDTLSPFHLPAVRRSSGRATHPIVPDVGMPGLYHRALEDGAFNPAQLAPQGGKSTTKTFRMLVLESPSPSVFPTALAQAAICHGSILTVTAGVTRLPDLQIAIRQVQHAGGTVLGTVLVDAPRIGARLGWRWAA